MNRTRIYLIVAITLVGLLSTTPAALATHPVVSGTTSGPSTVALDWVFTVSARISNAGPGTANYPCVSLSVPSGISFSVRPYSPQRVCLYALYPGSSATISWTLKAPSFTTSGNVFTVITYSGWGGTSYVTTTWPFFLQVVRGLKVTATLVDGMNLREGGYTIYNSAGTAVVTNRMSCFSVYGCSTLTMNSYLLNTGTYTISGWATLSNGQNAISGRKALYVSGDTSKTLVVCPFPFICTFT